MDQPNRRNADIASALKEAEESYVGRNPRSCAQNRQAQLAMPGGNTRTSLHYTPFPLTMARGEGAHLWDIDGHEYVDFLSEFTAGVFGHSHPLIRGAIDRALDGGWNLGAQGAAEAKFAAAIRAR
ncbi:MAG: aminotransferase class III-fold pyridoxal phosphate-dependent enzyme, partial [Alphaproteobacteria bacterium]|nr:aminotransferase class III-fold pyridoxal phosphate-dependent enzyme [Alphaproteobacteria bacterium]